MAELLDRFLREDATQAIRTLIAAKLRDAELAPAMEVVEFNFNAFDVVVHIRTGEVVVYDILDPNVKETLSLIEFNSALAHNNSLQARL